MSINTILFDLDGTLLPMDQDLFTKYYFGGLCKKMEPYGYDPEKLVAAIWSGTKAMVTGDGSRTCEEAFWSRFAEILGESVKDKEPIFADFYANEFQAVQKVCGYNPEAAGLIADLKAAGYRVVLATNPLFPPIATLSRARWAGLNPEDFELITTYDNSRFCKPNPAYYGEILEKIGVSPNECIMVGNDVKEDMAAATQWGLKSFLLTDCLLNKENLDTSPYPQGGFAELRSFLNLD